MNTSISKEQKNKLASYIKHGEIAVITANIEVENSCYREITFLKSTIGVRNNMAEGYVYIDNAGDVVKEKKLKENIAGLAYYNEFYYDTDSKISFSRAFMKNKDIKSDDINFKKATRALEALNLNGTNETNILKDILENVPKSKLKNNEIIKKIIDKVASSKERSESFNLETKDALQKIYDDLLMINYQMIRTIAEGENYYDDYKNIAKKKIGQFMIKYNRRVSQPLNKLIYELSYFKLMLKTYEKVVNLSYEQYFEYIRKVDKSNLQKRKFLIRI